MIRKHWLKVVLVLILLSEATQWFFFFTTARLTSKQFEVLLWDSFQQNTKIIPLLNTNIERQNLAPLDP